MLVRVLEPEVMDTAEEAEEYDAMDHGEVNRRFAEAVLAHRPDPVRVVDVGTGTARIPIALCSLHPSCKVVASDLANHMLRVARTNIDGAGLGDRIELVKADAKGARDVLRDGSFDVVMSNSIVHHIPSPVRLFEELLRLVSAKGLVFVRDLERPADEASLQKLVATYAANDTPKQRGLFEDSLRAALTLDEVIELVAPLGIPAKCVKRTSDRHWTLAFER
ncbi:MAG: class I SAM-dependent methyltransferase [Polyangiales bacterium]